MMLKTCLLVINFWVIGFYVAGLVLAETPRRRIISFVLCVVLGGVAYFIWVT